MYRIAQLLPPEEVLRLPDTATVREACRAMADARVGAAIVHDAEHQLAGIFSERDLLIRVVNEGGDPDQVKVGDVCTREVLTVRPDQRSGEVLWIMQEQHIRHVPVLDGDKIIGMLSLRHLLRADLEVKRNEVEAITAYIQGGVHPPGEGDDEDESEDDA